MVIKIQHNYKAMKEFAEILCWQTEVQNMLCILNLLAVIENACQMVVSANENATLIFPCCLHFSLGIYR